MMLFTLVKSLTKAEKRSFKLFCAPSSGVKYIDLYNAIEKMEVCEDKEVLRVCPNIIKSQLPNLKSQLYYQILRSLTQLYSNQNRILQIRQVIDFATVLIDKGLIHSAVKVLNRAKNEALQYQFYTLTLEVIEQLKNIALMHIGRSEIVLVDSLSEEATRVSEKITNINALSNLSIQFSGLNLKLGFARSEKDKTLIISYFYKKLVNFDHEKMDFHEKLYYYQCYTWYYLIQYDFVESYRWVKRWCALFEGQDSFKIVYFDHYIRANFRLLDILFMTRRLTQMKQVIANLEFEDSTFLPKNLRTSQSMELTLLLGKINVNLLEGGFSEGLRLEERVEQFVSDKNSFLQQHYRMLLNYKIACLFFGNGNYKGCIKYLHRIISVKDPKFRRDLQVFSRILNLIASYEIGDDETLDRQIKSVYSFVLKSNDMQAVQKAIINFLKRLPYTYANNFKSELKTLYDELKPLENDPYQRRPFFYLDIISYLESKLESEPIAEIRRKKIVLK